MSHPLKYQIVNSLKCLNHKCNLASLCSPHSVSLLSLQRNAAVMNQSKESAQLHTFLNCNDFISSGCKSDNARVAQMN